MRCASRCGAARKPEAMASVFHRTDLSVGLERSSRRCARSRLPWTAGVRRSRSVKVASASQQQETQVFKPPPFPSDYDQCLRQAQEAVKAALADGHRLLEVEFPATSLLGVQGDGEGQSEMNANMGYLRQFTNGFRPQAETTRVFFPDNKELAVAKFGQTMDPNAGRAAMEPKFGDTRFKLGYLTKQSAAWALTGFNMGSWSPVELTQDTDSLFIVGYPSFNPKEELKATYELYQSRPKVPIVIFNGELDHLRGGYYPTLFFPALAKITTEFLPQVTTAYYLHNFKGSRPGCLFRCYPGPWQVMRRAPFDPSVTKVIWESDKMPTLKQVSLEILASDLGLSNK